MLDPSRLLARYPVQHFLGQGVSVSFPFSNPYEKFFLFQNSDREHFGNPDFFDHSSSERSIIFVSAMAAKILANLIVMGSGLLARAFVQAYRQALTNASKSGVAQETLQNTVRRASKAMTEQEARQILGVSEQTAWEEILKKYDTLFERNAKSGSFYVQSKVHRAKECLESAYRDKGQGPS